MNYEGMIVTFGIVFVLVFLVDYFIINKRKLYYIKNKGVNKRGKKKNVKTISEIDYLVSKFKLSKRDLNMDKMIIVIALINSFIIAIVSAIVMLLDLNLVWQLLIAFGLLFGLIYALYEIYGKHLKKVEEKR